MRVLHAECWVPVTTGARWMENVTPLHVDALRAPHAPRLAMAVEIQYNALPRAA